MRDEVGLLGVDESKPIEAVTGRSYLPGRRIDSENLGQGHRPSKRVQLGRRGKAQVAVRGGAALEFDQPLGARVCLAQHDQTDHSERGQQGGEDAERDEQLHLNRRGYPRDPTDEWVERPYDFGSLLNWRM